MRWESHSVVLAATYGDSFTWAGNPRFELGALFFKLVAREIFSVQVEAIGMAPTSSVPLLKIRFGGNS